MDAEAEMKLSVIIACYGQPLMMARQLEEWHRYPDDVKEKLEVVVVDDHGKPAQGLAEDPGFPVQIYRVLEDIPWNQMGARNLGMQQATHPWRIMLDPDMVISVLSMQRIIQRIVDLRRGRVYKPWLKHMPDDCKPFDFGSPNLYVMHEEDWWAAGGYNEDFAGAKGYSDVVLHRTLHAFYRPVQWKDIWIDFYSERLIKDAQVTWLSRDLARNKGLFHQAVNFAARNGWKQYAKGVGNYLRFTWERVR